MTRKQNAVKKWELVRKENRAYEPAFSRTVPDQLVMV